MYKFVARHYANINQCAHGCGNFFHFKPVTARVAMAACPAFARGGCALLVVLAVSCPSSPALAKNSDIETAGNGLKFALPVAGLVLNIVHDDAEGALQLGASLLGAFGTSRLLKEIVREERPDKSDMDSFPSASTASSFAAASSIQARYGWSYGLPAYAMAAFVGYSRVAADKHHWHDVAAGAVIGWGIGQLVTSRYQPLPEIQAYAGADGAALQATWHW
jgi:membrane-associated phospholipid phosphatase